MNKNIFLLCLQGWNNAPWLYREVSESWEINNPDWKIHYIDFNNLKDYVDDIDYIYDKSKDIRKPAKSDIIRLSLLKNHGGVWADASLLCMQPLDHWAQEAVSYSGIWMYHACIDPKTDFIGCASWFILSEKSSYIINKWKEGCDIYWSKMQKMHTFLWMNSIFKDLFFTDNKFRNEWVDCCHEKGLDMNSEYGSRAESPDWLNDNKFRSDIFLNTPPYAIKLTKFFMDSFSDPTSIDFKNSSIYNAIKMSKRKFVYKHPWQSPKKCN